MEDRESLESLLAHTQDIVVVLDEGGRIQYANAAAERILGYGERELRGETVFERIHPGERADVQDVFESVVTAEAERSATVEHRFRAADGSWVWLESAVANREAEDLEGYVVSARDVTDRRRAERDRRETRRRLEELAARTDDVLWMFDAEWSEILFVNAAYEEMYGRPVATLRSDPRDFMNAIHPEDRERVRAAMEQLSGGEPADIEYRVNPGEEFRRWVWVQASPVLEDGEVVRIVGFSRDVTERREYRQQLQVMDRVLRHNLHNDMNVVLGYAEQALVAADEAVAADLRLVLDHGEALLETVAKQREVVELVDPTASLSRLDVAAVTREFAATEANEHPAATLELDVPETAPALAIDTFDRAVEELLDNAFEHGDPDQTVAVTVRDLADEDAVELVVADGGPPIPDEEIGVLTGDREIEPLFHGSGLGLWLINWAVRRSDGELSFECGEPAGNRVTVRLRRAD